MVNAQVVGVSANKLTLLSASILDKGSFEFEPAFSVFNSNNIFNERGNLSRIAEHNISSSLDFRLTAGLTDNLEVGTSISSNIEEINFGSKYLLINNDDFGFVLSGGFSLPAGNKVLSDSEVRNELLYTATFGPVLSYNISDKSSIDFALSYTTAIGKVKFDDLFYGGIGWGYSFSEKLQAVLEVAGYACFDNELCSGKLSVFPGFTYDIIENFSFAYGFQYDFMGKNEDGGFGYFGAFTISFN